LFLVNLERWETETEGRVGLGGRYIVHWKIGSVPVGGTVEVVVACCFPLCADPPANYPLPQRQIGYPAIAVS
jgi:hypothetical protein